MQYLTCNMKHWKEVYAIPPNHHLWIHFFWGTDGQRRPPKPLPDSPLHHHFAWIFATSQIRKGVPLRTVGWREMSMLRCCVCIIDILGYFSDAGSLTVRVLLLQPRYKVLGVWEFQVQALGLTSFKSISGFDTICYQYVDFEALDQHCEDAAWSSDCSVFFCGQFGALSYSRHKSFRIWWQRNVCWTQPARAACWITIWLLSFVINKLRSWMNVGPVPSLGNPTGQPWRQHPWSWPVARSKTCQSFWRHCRMSTEALLLTGHLFHHAFPQALQTDLVHCPLEAAPGYFARNTPAS